MKRPFTSLYVHVPFCASKCAYCVFYSLPDAAAKTKRAWLDRLRAEFAARAPACGVLRSVYVGGGTPTVLRAAELAELLGGIRRSFRLEPGLEFTVECNPETLTPDKGRALTAAGVNRVSLGVQSFDPDVRRALGRRGTAADVDTAVQILQACGVRNLGADLIYGAPGQTVSSWRCDLVRACELGIAHLSTYELTIEEGSRLARAGVSPPSPDEALVFWETTDAVAETFGLARYEVSNLARPGFECRHNVDVWYGGTVLGCGPAASSFDGETRYATPADLDRWLRSSHREADRLSPRGRALEVLAFGLRTVRGWFRSSFRDRTGFEAMALRGPEIRELADDGLLVIEPNRIRPTQRGLLFADTIAELLIE